MKIIIDRLPYTNTFRVWRENRMAGVMRSEMAAKICESKEEMLKEVGRLTPEIDEETVKKIDEAEKKLFEKYKKIPFDENATIADFKVWLSTKEWGNTSQDIKILEDFLTAVEWGLNSKLDFSCIIAIS